MEFIYKNFIYFIPVFGLLALAYTAARASWVSKQDAGDEKMQKLAGHIADGAMAFLKAEWKVLGIFAAIMSLFLIFLGMCI